MLKFDLVNFVCVIINLVVLYVLMKKFVFGRVTKIIDARQAMLEEKNASVAKAQKEADELKLEYEKSLENAHETSVQIVKDAKDNARAEYNKIMARAAADAEAMKAGAEKAIATEREKQMDELHVQIMDLAVEAAGKIMAEKSSQDTDKALYDAFINQAGDVDDGKNE
jgi:F-type H+-transporting ATPase subunit b